MNFTTIKYKLTLLLSMSMMLATAQTVDYTKLSPWVRQTAHTIQGQQSRRAATSDGRVLTAFVQTTVTDATQLLRHYGCTTYAQQGDISIATIPLGQLAALSREPAVRRIEAREPASVTMDTVAKCINALPAYTATTDHEAFTGRGVVMGVMDIGFDVTHPTFYTDGSLTQTRIKALWDQLTTDTIGSPLPVGRDYVSEADIISKGGSTDSPTLAHGTHTLGIAAGNGYDTPYRGIAYESDICLVSNAVNADTLYIDPADYYKFTSATDALGFKYMFDYADAQGKPCVVSFSEGYPPYIDEEDSLFNAFLEGLLAPGHIIVASAGNENTQYTYAEKPASKEAAGAFVRCNHQQALYRILYDKPATISLYGYGKRDSNVTASLHFATDDPRLDSLLTDTLLLGSDTLEVSVTRYASAFQTDSVCAVMLSAKRNISELPYVALVIEGIGCHAEIFGSSSYSLTSRSTDTRWNAARKGHNIFAPGCFPSVICVGATAHRASVVNYKGQQVSYSGNDKGTISSFSSTGPTMSGLSKPDVTAPGCNVISSYNHYFMEANPDHDYALIGYSDVSGTAYPWAMDSGTSMSCPIVAGTIALWLQACPTLTTRDVLAVFSRTCRQPDDTLDYPNDIYGYGDIDAYRGLLDILGLSNIKSISQQQPQGATVSVRDGQLHIRFAVRPQQPVTVNIYSTDGTLQHTMRLTPSLSDIVLPMPRLAAGVYAVQLTGSDAHVTGSQLVRL